MGLPAQQIPPGEQIGPYQVVRRLGAGGMGEVYLARHRHLNRDAAVKVLLPEISMNQTMVSRFFTEARATAQLRHPHIVEIFDCDVLPDGRAYIVMEYLRGESLRGTLDRVGKLGPDYGSILAISGMTADGLQAAHENGIVHRDLKPDNTYLTSAPGQREGILVKILDFGIAKLLSGDRTGSGATPTRTGSLIGTPLYMSPEQCRGISTIDHRADIYSLGCMVYEMVVGQPPFVAEAPGDILMAHIMQPAPALTSLQPDVPPQIDAMVAQMLAKDPAARPQSMADIVSTVEALLGVRKTDFGPALRRPAGFPDVASQVATQILPADDVSGPRQTPSPPWRESPSGRGALGPSAGAGSDRGLNTPLGNPLGGANRGSSTSGGGPAPTQADGAILAAAALSSGRGRPKSSGDGRQRPASAGGVSADSTDFLLRPSPLRRFLPAIIILAVVALGGTAAYFVTRPSPAPESDAAPKGQNTAAAEPGKPADPTPPGEVEVEILSNPEGAAVQVTGESSSRGKTPAKFMLPRSSATVEIVLRADGYLDKRLAIDASRDRTMNINLEREPSQARDPDKIMDEAAQSGNANTKKRKSGSRSPAPTSGGFKAVGD
jgi:eukaryotic-like serine/threonine-protein kinase